VASGVMGTSFCPSCRANRSNRGTDVAMELSEFIHVLSYDYIEPSRCLEGHPETGHS
jgi:hypothetical protein